MSERRCPTCGALVSADAEWCGQCYASLRAPAAEPVHRAPVAAATEGRVVPAAEEEAGAKKPEPASAAPVPASEAEPAWPCPVCGNRNPIELNRCAVCGTSFARLFQDTEPGPRVSPREAAVWSLALPGLGHWKSGRALDAIVWMAISLWTVGTVVLMLLSRTGSSGLGPTIPLLVLFVAAIVVLWVTSAVDAHRIASGVRPLVTSRALLWGSVALVILSVVLLATLVVVPASRAR